MTITRRQACLSALASIALPTVAYAQNSAYFNPQYPRLRLGTELISLFENLEDKGYGISRPGAEKLPNVVIVFDTQCHWCTKLWKASQPFWDRFDFTWYPVAEMNDLSISEGALILSSPKPWSTLKYMQEHYRSKDYSRIQSENAIISPEYRNQVWRNSKIFRRGGGTIVPLGIYKNIDEKYIPIFSGTTSEELEKILG